MRYRRNLHTAEKCI